LNIAAGLNKQRNRNNSNSKRSASKTSNVYPNAYSNNQDIDVEQLPPPPSFMRPSTAPPAGKRVNFHDPVKRFAEYNKYWNSQPRCNPKRDHKRTTQIKWQVRNELADLVRENDRRLLRVKEEMGDYGGHQTRKSESTQNFQIKDKKTYIVPTEKKRNDIRWQIRNILHESGQA